MNARHEAPSSSTPHVRVRTSVRAGKIMRNRCETLAALRVRTSVRAGRIVLNRCETLAAA
jgi:hypothetical protein